jgi:hypothetical protein
VSILFVSRTRFGRPKRLPFALAFRRLGFDPFHDQTSLKLGNSTQDGKDDLPGRRAGVELLGEGNRLNALRSERLKGSKQMAHRSREAVELQAR